MYIVNRKPIGITRNQKGKPPVAPDLHCAELFEVAGYGRLGDGIAHARKLFGDLVLARRGTGADQLGEGVSPFVGSA